MPWSVAIAQLYQQEKVIEQLANAGFEYFFPRIKKTVRHRGRRVHRFEPLLFNYIPVRIHGQSIFDMRGVAGVIGPASTTEIEKLRARCDTDGVLIQRTQRFLSGQKVIVKEGPLMDLVGEFVDERREREVALFNILGAMRPVEFKQGDLVAA